MANKRDRGFSLLELVVAIAIVAVLFGVLLPALSGARGNARSAVCQSSLRSLMGAVYQYSTDATDFIVPSYNMRGVSGSASNPLDGWGPILDKGRFISGSRNLSGNPFCCPNTVNIAGLSAAQTGTNPSAPKGYMDWPAAMTISSVYATTIPARGFTKVIRVGYWINADNPIGRPQTITQGIHFSGSVGYGPDPQGKLLQPSLFSKIKTPSRLIALADGLYAGKQEATRLGDRDSRIGYRHSGSVGTANVAFADGHVGNVRGDRFPRKASSALPLDAIRQENGNPFPTVYSDPAAQLHAP